jgi:hypothetical protein
MTGSALTAKIASAQRSITRSIDTRLHKKYGHCMREQKLQGGSRSLSFFAAAA